MLLFSITSPVYLFFNTHLTRSSRSSCLPVTPSYCILQIPGHKIGTYSLECISVGVSGCDRMNLSCHHLFDISVSSCHLVRGIVNMLLVVTCSAPVLCVDQFSKGIPLPPPQAVTVLEQLSTFCVLFSIKLFTLHDAEFYRDKESECTLL